MGVNTSGASSVVAIKPDIVMEGGYLAIDPTTGRADYAMT